MFCVPMDDFNKKIEAMKQEMVEDIELGADTISGKVNVSGTRILCFAVPSSGGWTAYIDGNKEDHILVNEHYLGLIVPSVRYFSHILDKIPNDNFIITFLLISGLFLIIKNK